METEGFGKGRGRGGARHFSKPYVDSGLIYKVLHDNQEILRNLGSYEHCSRANAPCPKGLVWTLPLWKGILKVESSGEVHPQPLKTALISLLAEEPTLNETKHSGQIWCNLKLERLNCILFHVRKLGRESLTAAASKLNREDYTKLQQALKLLDLPSALEKATSKSSLEKEPPALEKAKSLEQTVALVPVQKTRKLKKDDSEVSMDSKGFPKMFAESASGSPPKQNGNDHSDPACFARRRPGQLAPLEKGDLQAALGYGNKCLKRPAAALEKASKAKPMKAKGQKKSTSSMKATPKEVEASLGKEKRKPWAHIKKTVAKINPRAYLTGTTEKKGKLKLIVEVSGARCPDFYSQMIDEIWTALQKDNLTKAEAKDLREQLCEDRDWGAKW